MIDESVVCLILSSQRNALVSHVWSSQGQNLMFRRALNDWEVAEIVSLLQIY